jgi:hypothetical protein
MHGIPSSEVCSVDISATLKKQLKSLKTALFTGVVDSSAFQIIFFFQVGSLFVLILYRHH